MSDEAVLAVTKCDSPDCGQEDDHPKFLLYAPPLLADFSEEFGGPRSYSHEHDSDEDGWVTYHHDCAAALGHKKAQIIVDATQGAKGSDLRSHLTNTEHPVHAAVAKHSQEEYEATQQ